jgi:hypothetical protein
MEFPPELGTIEGVKNLRDWFGYWPSFHDAEVSLLHLNRSDASTLAVHTWEMTKEVDEKGFYVLAKHVVVEFVMKEVVGLSLNGFNHQNVVFGLAIERVDSGYRLTLEDCYGVAGTIDASDISIRLIPGKPREAS